MKTGDVIYLVVPCYNEEDVLSETAKRLSAKIDELIVGGKISADSRILFVDDGSSDKTWEMIRTLHDSGARFAGLKLSRNRGHQNALLAGLIAVKDLCAAAISMDADLQDDVGAVDLFVEKYAEGNDIVYGVRKDRSHDTTVKRGTAETFYRIMTKMGVESIFNHADCRLMSQRALGALSEYKEVNLFLRGMVPLIGFKSARVEYDRAPRFAGQSKYPFKKMLQLALNGITSFSITPIRLISVSGAVISALGLLTVLALAVLSAFGSVISPAGWILSSLWLVCGLLMGSVGVVGEYVGKSYEEIKARPRYFIETFLK